MVIFLNAVQFRQGVPHFRRKYSKNQFKIFWNFDLLCKIVANAADSIFNISLIFAYVSQESTSITICSSIDDRGFRHYIHWCTVLNFAIHDLIVDSEALNIYKVIDQIAINKHDSRHVLDDIVHSIEKMIKEKFEI